MQHSVANAEHLRERLIDSGYFQLMNETQRIPVVAMTLDPKVTNFNEFDVSAKVREKGWVLSAYSMPPNAEQVNSLRVVVRPHLNQHVTNRSRGRHHRGVRPSESARRDCHTTAAAQPRQGAPKC